MSLTYILLNNIPQLMVIRIIHGAFSGMIVPIARAWVGDIAPIGEEGKWMGYFNATHLVGMGTGPLLGGVIAEYYSMDVAFAAMAGLLFIAFVGATFFLHESGQRKGKEHVEPSFRKMSGSGLFRGLFMHRSMSQASRGGFMAFFPIYCSVHIGLGTMLIGVLVAVHLYLTSSLQILSGRIADRFDRKRLLIMGSLFEFVFMAITPLTSTFWQLLGLIIIRSIGTSISMPADSALSVEEGRRFGMGSTIAALALAAGIGMGIGPILSGVFADLGGIQSAFYFTGGIGILGIILFSWYSRQRSSEGN